ncbi:sodium:proton antiporter [Synechococcus sp. PCC 7336]|uniref:cation:proton antiporter n=1 Tax=Synechococcus sp. PCC 7336 TaxID=195250 RepID=UPI00034D859B|nr:cation:proton antiporter [Synechococcus sp. PCC 7336]
MSPLLTSWLWILLGGFIAGQLARRLGAPPLLGAILVGLALGWGQAIAPEVLEQAAAPRTLAVTIVLMRAGLGLDRSKLAQQGTVALRLGVLPGACEAIAIAAISTRLLGFDWPTGLLLGCIVGAESPAVIVPGMLRLKSTGWGVTKGIADAILTGSALSDALLLLVFSLLLNLLTQGSIPQLALPGGWSLNAAQLLPLQVLLQVGLGVAIGYGVAWGLVRLLAQQRWTQNATQDLLVAAGISLLLVLLAQRWPYFSGYLAAMSMGFFLIELDAPLARRLRAGFNGLWVVAEIALFVLLGASLDLAVLGDRLLSGLAVLTVGLLLGRTAGWYLSTVGSDWTWRERLYLLPGNSAKATVQAAIGAVPLSQGLAGGETILAIAALSILVTAPLGAWAIPFFAPKLLQRGTVDPAKVALSERTRVLAAVDTSALATSVLLEAANFARRTDGDAILLHVCVTDNREQLQSLHSLASPLLADIRYRWIAIEGSIPETIVQVARDCQATNIVMGRRGHRDRILLGSVSQAVLETSPLPVMLVEDRDRTQV